MLDFWDVTVGGAMAGGFGFARAVGEMTWALRQLPGVDELVGYEARLNKFLPRYPQVVLCLYALDSFSGEVLVDVLKTHPKVLLGGMCSTTPTISSRTSSSPRGIEPEALTDHEALSMHAVEVGQVAAMDTELREQLSNLQGLLMLSMLMIESGDETTILQLAASAVPSFRLLSHGGRAPERQRMADNADSGSAAGRCGSRWQHS